MVHTYRRTFAGRPLEVEIGKLAGQATGACRLQYGETVLLVTATDSREPRPGIDFFPLTVDYEERLYAAGKIPGSFFRREGRPTTEAILAGRLTDRAIRPLFPKGFRNDVQVIITILSADQENDPDTWGTVGASIALGVSDIPFGGPISSVRVGYIDGEFITNPTFEQRDRSELDLVVAATRDAVVMVEAGAKQVPEAVVLEAMRFGFQANQELLDLQEEIIRELGKPKMVFTPTPMTDEVRQVVAEWAADKVNELIPVTERAEREAGIAERREELLERFGETYTAEQLLGALDEEIKKAVRKSILEENRRPDGRTPTELRPITCEVGLLPRTHGSGLFQRGQTQVMTIATLGSLGEEQRLDTLEPEETKRFIHHYNFPPFSVGETRRLGSPGRREIGHGALAERALEPVIPKVDDFPYTIRLVSEVLSSNGSTSMASVCGSTLALMDAGVPISDPVAGVAMGLVMGEDGRFAILTDIAGVEDALGDMDFKVAGTAAGITALQMDIKITGLTFAILEQALAQAREARLFILEKMREVIPEARPELSRYAPRIYRIKIPPEKIGTVIGPGGRVIRSIIDETKTTIDIQDDGTVFIGASNEDAARQAIQIIEGLTKEAEVGQIYTGKVTRLTNFGAFVEIMPGKEGLVHISELADYRVPRVEDVVQVGDEIMVMVTEIDPLGRINLSRRAVLEGETPQAVAERASERVSGGRREGSPGSPARRNGGDRGIRGGNGRAGGVRPEPRRAPTSRGGGGPGFSARRGEGPSGPLPPPRPPFRGR